MSSLNVSTKLFDFVDDHDPLRSPPPDLEFTDHDSVHSSSATSTTRAEADSSGDTDAFSFYSASECSDSSVCGDNEDIHEELDQAIAIAPLTLTIKGLYTNSVIPGARFLPKDYTEKDLKKHQFMCRKRMNTKPLPSSTDSDNNTETETEIGNKQGQEAMFLPGTGLVNGYFWHLGNNNTDPDKKRGLMEDRAILFQSEEHYERIIKDPRFSSCFDDIDYKTTPSFGEQVIVQGCDSSQLAVGDIFEVEGKLSPLIVEITSPRKPCYHVNKRHGSAKGTTGMQRHALTNSLSGWFTRVLVGGELRDGMKLIRTQHPNPKWTLAEVSTALYAEGSKLDFAMCKAQWNRSKSELQELVNLPQLGKYEWKDEAEILLKRWKDNHDNEEEEKEEKGFFSYFGNVKEKDVTYRSTNTVTRTICVTGIVIVAMMLK